MLFQFVILPTFISWQRLCSPFFHCHLWAHGFFCSVGLRSITVIFLFKSQNVKIQQQELIQSDFYVSLIRPIILERCLLSGTTKCSILTTFCFRSPQIWKQLFVQESPFLFLNTNKLPCEVRRCYMLLVRLPGSLFMGQEARHYTKKKTANVWVLIVPSAQGSSV